MHVVSLNIGPSEVSAAVRADLAALAAGELLSESHRGDVVREELKGAVAALRTAMGIPEAYAVVFQPSATACMELVLRNTVARHSFHFVHGAFSGRMASTAQEIGLAPIVHQRAWDESAAPEHAQIDDTIELIALAHCETSTGQMWPTEAIAALRARHPEPLLCVDVTSSFGALAMDWTQADVWFSSVQKCLGLPAGLGVLIASPRAVERARILGADRRVAGWQDLAGMAERIRIGETQETPNVLAIALLRRQMGRWDLPTIEAETRAKAAIVQAAMPDEAFFVRDAAWRSSTAHNLLVDDPAAVRARVLEAGYAIGAGYGPLRERCVRIATFPSVTTAQVESVMRIVAG